MGNLITTAFIAFLTSGYQPEVEVKIVGEIPAICTIAGHANDVDNLKIDAAGRARTSLNVSCNAPFNLKLSSENGAFTSDRTRSTNGFQNSLVYRVSTRLRLDENGQLRIKNCDSTALFEGQSCSSKSSDGQTAINRKLRINVAWDAPSQPLLAGSYSDSIRVRLEPTL